MLSLKAPDSVWEKVKTGETYKADHIDIDGVDYTGVYLPLKNYNGNIVGMLFAGEPRTAIEGYSTCGSNNYCSFSNSSDIIDAFQKNC